MNNIFLSASDLIWTIAGVMIIERVFMIEPISKVKRFIVFQLLS
jgi:hypothetical protein